VKLLRKLANLDTNDNQLFFRVVFDGKLFPLKPAFHLIGFIPPVEKRKMVN